MSFAKILFFFLGSFFLGLGFLGVFLPGLPTTPFVLLAAWFYLKSSRRLYRMVVNSKLFGPFIDNYRSKSGIPLALKIYSVGIMWVMITVSCLFFIPRGWITILLVFLGLVGTVVKVFVLPTREKNSN